MAAHARVALALLCASLTVAAGCAKEETSSSAPLVVEDGCQPLLARTSTDEVSQGTCLLPYPSDFYRTTEADGTTRIVLKPAAKPRKSTGQTADLHEVIAMDGFSLIPTIVATLPSRIAVDGLPGILDDPNLSARASSATVIIDADSGAFVPHYTDKIDRGLDDTHDPIVLRTFAPLMPKKRYIVALRGVRLAPSEEGAPSDPSRLAPPPEGFGRLRDGQTNDPALDPLRERFERDVFAPLVRAGVQRKDLQLAWDFTTGSAEQPRTDMLRVRELALAWLAQNPSPIITITESKPGTDRIWRTVSGTVTAPLFLDQPKPGGHLFRGSDGQVAQNGTTPFDFTLNIPISVRDRFAPGLAMAFGHGFFGGRTELEGALSKTIAERLAAVEIGIDWWGMAKEDTGHVGDTLGDNPEHGADFTDRVHQAMANWIVMTAAIKGPLAKLPELARPSSGPGVVIGPGGASNAGQPVYDANFVAYFGASMGGILGGTLLALDPDFSRAVLNVGGGGFTHMMPRSGSFGPFSIVLDITFKDALMTQAYIAMFQRAIDRIDPVTYAPLSGAQALPGTPAQKTILLQVGLGDAAVPNAGSFLLARALGLKQTMPAPQSVFGLEPASDPMASALTLFDFHIDTSGSAKPSPLDQNEVHEGLRVNPAALTEMDNLLRPSGTIMHPCDGPCDPE